MRTRSASSLNCSWSEPTITQMIWYPRCLNEHVDRKLRAGIEKGNGGKRIGCILGAAQRREMELIGERMPHFVKADEQHVADDEVGLVARVLRRRFVRRRAIGGRALMLSHGNGAADCAEEDCESGEGLRKHGERPVLSLAPCR